jgi:hypothetical protein
VGILPVPLRRSGVDRLAHGLLAVAVAGLAGAMAFGLVDGPPCPLATFLRVLCPMCGTTRAVRALLAGDLAGALRWNPLFPGWCALGALAFLELLHRAAGGRGRGPGERALGALAARPALLRAVQAILLAQAVHANTVQRGSLLLGPGE